MLEKLTGFQSRNFPHFKEPECSLRRLQVPATCLYSEPDQARPYPPPNPIPLPEDPSYYYPPIYNWVFQVVSFPQVSPPKPCMQIIKLLIMWFPPFACYLIPLRTKYSLLHPILRLPQPMFLPQYQRPSFTPIQNKQQSYCSICLNLYIFG